MRNMLTNRIGILGFGCVGQGLYDVLQYNRQMEVARICVRDKGKARSLPASAFTYDPQELLQDDSLLILTELINDPAEALILIRQALKAGKTVVSANKKVVAENLPELVALQKHYGGRLLYEAAVCGSIPILRTLEAYYGTEPLLQVRGILNGSSNYILSRLDTDGSTYEAALVQAQELGFAEADPAMDVQGYDALHKICLIAAHAFGVFVQPDHVLCFGIDTITAKDIVLAQKLGARIRLVASARVTTEEQLEVQVLPTFVFPSDELYHVQDEYNGVQIQAKFAGDQFLKGKGAGSYPTGSAVWADVSAALNGYRYTYPKYKPAVATDPDTLLQVYIRMPSDLFLTNIKWNEVTSFGVNPEELQLIGFVKRRNLNELQKELIRAKAFIALLPENVTPEAVIKASCYEKEAIL
ncbi:homoserine dehydrogenase [Pontibacter sp. MBLB2868]|uniref:homoserine dehydrogenase n=1 Tax=Pontibacter sp. MBLB2868 TaxID=3451555 RepID=UPI003F7548DC